MESHAHPCELSIVLPLYDEAESLPQQLREIAAALAGLEGKYEILCVDDASRDGSEQVLRDLQREYDQLRCLRHAVNSGQSAALLTGIQRARGAVVVMMDGDLQYDARDIPRLYARLNESGADCVAGVRRRRRDSRIKKISSRIANAYRNLITGDHITDAGCAFRAARRAALREVPPFNGLHRFLPTLLRAQGYRVVELEVEHRPRVRGVSKYGVHNRLWRGIADCFAVRWYRRRAFSGARNRNG